MDNLFAFLIGTWKSCCKISTSYLRTGMIISAGMIEGAALFAIIVCFLTLILG